MKRTVQIRRKNAKSPAKIKLPLKTMPRVTPSWVGRIPQLKPGRYADGLPLHQIEYVCCKLILRPNRFTSRQSLFDFAKVMKAPAEQSGVGLTTKGFQNEPLKIREVLFMDTADFRLYNNAFILRRRIPYQDGFPVGEPEIVFKFRHPDLRKAAETDVRPQIIGDHRVKFKCQALPLKDRLGGIRVLFSHNVQFPRSSVAQNLTSTFETMSTIFPVLQRLKHAPDEKIQLVSETIVEEVLQDIGLLDFGKGITAKTNVSLWRTRGQHRPLIGEFAFQIRFKDRKDLAREAMQRAEAFFIALQYAAESWITLNATKTGVVYRLLGNPPKSHE
ncbi:MAG: hypothetical protein ACLQAH_11525 [Limisphaerales bacterium]